MSQQIILSAAISTHASVAFHQNEVPLVAEVVLNNEGEADLADVEIRIEAEPAFAAPALIRLDRLAAQSSRHISPVDIKLDAGYLRQLRESLRGSLTVTARQGDTMLAEQQFSLEVYPPSHWGGTGTAPELIAAFVRPNDPAIDVVLHDASARLAAAGCPSGLDGYRSGRRERTWEVASAIWSSLAGYGLTYVLPPASFERAGQKVRGPGDVLERKTGTCLDLALLYAACLEQAGLNTVLVLTEGHAFLGLWLKQEDFSSVAIDDMQTLRKRRDLEELIFVETTFLTHVPASRFADAVKQGAASVEEDAAPLEVAIDLARARARHIKPLDLGEVIETNVRAQRGARAMAEAFAPTGGETESPFEDAVKAALEALGWTVHPQIGVSGFRVDLGVVDPDAPGRYLAGIECDGATYHRSATARDRDRLREQVLRGLGWRIHRVWSTDWWIIWTRLSAAFMRRSRLTSR